MPSEDYYRTLMIQAIGRALNVATPMIDTLLLRYENTVKQYCDTHIHQQLSRQFELHHFKQDLALVTNYLTFINKKRNDISLHIFRKKEESNE